MQNRFGANEEWPKQRPRVRCRRVKNDEAEPEIEDSGSQDDFGDEMFQHDQTLSLDDVKVEVENSVETPSNNSQSRVKKPPIPITYQNKNPSRSQVDMN